MICIWRQRTRDIGPIDVGRHDGPVPHKWCLGQCGEEVDGEGEVGVVLGDWKAGIRSPIEPVEVGDKAVAICEAIHAAVLARALQEEQRSRIQFGNCLRSILPSHS